MRAVTIVGWGATLLACVDAPVVERGYEDSGVGRHELDAGRQKPPTRSRGSGGAPPYPPPVTRSWEAGTPAADRGEPGASGSRDVGTGRQMSRTGGAAGGGGGAVAADRGGGVRPAQAGALVISELMVDPKAVADAEGEWFELHNPGNGALSLQGCTIADGGGQARAIDDAAMIRGGGFASIARSEAAGFSPALVTSFSLKNGADVLELRCDGVVIDRVEYDKARGFPVAAGVAMSLDARALAAASNDVPSAWCGAREPYAVDLGSPGAPNPPCGDEDDAGAGD